MKRKIHCVFPQEIIHEPLLYRIGQEFEVVPNVRGAAISDEFGEMDLELEGEEAEIERVIAYLQSRGVEVKEIER